MVKIDLAQRSTSIDSTYRFAFDLLVPGWIYVIISCYNGGVEVQSSNPNAVKVPERAPATPVTNFMAISSRKCAMDAQRDLFFFAHCTRS